MDIIPAKPEISTQEINIIFLGTFNPRIYHPAWLSQHNLIRDSEADKANIEIIHPDIASFSTDWFVMQITPERFFVAISAPVYKDHLYDLAIGIFKHLIHTPISKMGINYVTKIHFKNQEDWNAFGHFLAPKSPWNNVLSKPGMRRIDIQSIKEDNDLPGYVLVSAEPVMMPGSNEAIVKVNDHSECPEKHERRGAAFFIDRLEQDFNESIKRSEAIIQGLINNFINKQRYDNGE